MVREDTRVEAQLDEGKAEEGFPHLLGRGRLSQMFMHLLHPFLSFLYLKSL